VKAKIEIKCLKKINKRLTLMCELRKVKENAIGERRSGNVELKG